MRYLARAQEHAAVLSLAFPPRFRSQFTEGRSFNELQADIGLTFASAKAIYDPVVVFRLLLMQDELGRRWSSLKDAPAIIDALLAVGDVERAEALAEDMGDDGYKVIDALLSTGELDRARSLSDRLEPLQQLLSGTMREESIGDSTRTLEWARRVIHFRNPDQINQAVERIAAAAAKSPGNAVVKESADNLAAELRHEVALSIMASQPDADVEEVARSFQLEKPFHAGLLVEAGQRAAVKGARDLSMRRLRAAIEHDAFSSLPNGWRRRVALTLARSGDMHTARAIFHRLVVPSVSALDREIGEAMPERVAEAVLEHAELAAMLKEVVPETTASARAVMRPLQLHASTIGTLLGRARVDPDSVSRSDVARAARTALAYLEQAKASDAGEHYAVIQIASATPVLGMALIQAAALCGADEFSAVLAEFDRAFAVKNSRNSMRANLRREVAVAVYDAGGDAIEASARLEPLAESVLENTPAAQIEALSDLAKAFVYVNRKSEGRFSVEMVRENIAEDDAVEIEDATMAEYAATIVNRQNMHAPYDRNKLLAYSDAIRAYDDGLRRADSLAKAGSVDEAINEFEAAYVRYLDVIRNSDYNQGARRGLESTAFDFHPHALADRYTKALAKAGRYIELVAFSQRYFRDYGEPANRTEEALKQRAEKARAKIR